MDVLWVYSYFNSKAEKSNTSAKGLLGIANKLMNFLAIPSKSFALVFDFSALLGELYVPSSEHS
jgi:hypothetical protein